MIPTYYAGGERPLTPDDISQSEAKILGKIIIKSPTIPTASADTLGEVRQYVGETGANYIHGYIYECVVEDDTYSWERIDVQPGGSRGRFLAIWNCTTGLAESNPPTSPYPYATGDYFIVGAVDTTNYKPSGSSYVIGTASTVVETAEVKVDDTYYFDGTNWKLQSNTSKTVSFAGIAGDIYDNTSASTALNAKQDTISDLTTIRSGAAAGATAVQPAALSAYQTTSNLVTSISSSSTDIQYPSAKCVYDIVGNIETVLQGI